MSLIEPVMRHDACLYMLIIPTMFDLFIPNLNGKFEWVGINAENIIFPISIVVANVLKKIDSKLKKEKHLSSWHIIIIITVN